MGGGTSERATSFEAASILAEARERTGLDDFGEDSFREPMERLLRSLEQEAELSPAGRAMQRARLVGLLVNRLRTEDHFRRFPEIAGEEIREPLVIVGLARTGTTMLHRMIACDPRIFSLLWWESRNPAPFPDAKAGREDPRIADAAAEVAAMVEGAPELVAMHPIEAEQPDEEIMLLEHSFFSTNPEAFADVPSFGAWLDEQDQTPGYLYLKRLLQFLQWQKRRAGGSGERWVLKTPHHLGFVDLLFRVFPDARVIQTHRDPIETIPSLASLIHAVRSLASDVADPRATGRQWSGRMSRALAHCMRVRADHEDRFIDVWFRHAMRDPLAQIRRIYDFAGMLLTPEAVRKMERWSVENARDKRIAHSYTLEQFGLTEDGIRRDFAAYRERFITRDG